MSVWEQGGHPSPVLAFEDWPALVTAPAGRSCRMPLLPSTISERGNPHSRPPVCAADIFCSMRCPGWADGFDCLDGTD